MGSGDYAFMPTPAEGQTANIFSAAMSLACMSISCLVLGLALFLYRYKALRHHFSKTSTQLLYLCVAITIPQGLAFASTTLNVGTHEKSFCRLGMVIVVFGFNATNWLQCCICLNLVFALRCPSIFRYRIQLWYYISAVVTSAIFALLPLIFDQYEYNARSYSCWTRDTGDVYNVWQLVVLEIPILVVTLLMFLSTGFVIWNVIKQKRDGRSSKETINQLFEPAFVEDADDLAVTSDTNMNKRFEIEEIYTNSSFNPRMLPESPATPPSRRSPRSETRSPRAPSFVSRAISSSNRGSPAISKMMGLITEEPQSPRKLRVARLPTSAHFGRDPAAREQSEMRKTILRISCFPIIHLLIAIVPLIGSISLTFARDSGRGTQLGLYLITFIGSAGLPLAYSACALLTDTSIYDAWAERRRMRAGDQEESLELALGRNRHRLSQLSYTEPADPNTPKEYGGGGSGDGIEKSVTVSHVSSDVFYDSMASPTTLKSASRHFGTLEMDTIAEEDRSTVVMTREADDHDCDYDDDDDDDDDDADRSI
ncbi:protein of unknown function [Taphrina deformans PYCC 5710]|uniref:G-protein coupled receptors family 2 profile 2 domain-containing protein n=1 Tax=Taphrina deformans (strain PYCC 5710 / ATCC 11124 / CBS 356.35 / IMI 108563 / JCM 9778 / NBRC 8474) TaxID=1097556 RepID=R4X6A5_TAPDE|nr:protein of unknown function [Taphrina deformans PYCC 5710]|eukprot:CCG80549.1 protein of unknown function [Taphrina deformans PYCC 5710]